MEALVTAIQSAKRIALISHVHPDGDAVGSLVGLKRALESIGKQATATLVDPIPHAFVFLNAETEVGHALPEDADLCIVLDAGDAARTGFTDTIRAYATTNRLGMIDHHPKGDLGKLAAYQVHSLEASSASELVLKTCQALGVKLTSTICTPLLTGMYTDTGGFQLPNTTIETLELAAELMRRGGRLRSVVNGIASSRTLAGLKLLGIALERVKATLGGACMVSVLLPEDFGLTGALPEDTTGIVNQINVLPHTKIAALLIQSEPNLIRGVLRTADGEKTNVGNLARLLGGGGHPRAAGFMVPGRIVLDENDWRIEPPSS